ncbi:sugar phosphate isomerase/epimerase family protein [Arenibacter echinorum]|uniref:Sugar phosphate isomerase/epimerase n=1 Tax=Arenibacter echinorum TaxID=440515 RepID=A0A327RBJ8_9FLAO|nr:sugar phosphate isomerase/epimerase [Arenibacter echinorum]
MKKLLSSPVLKKLILPLLMVGMFIGHAQQKVGGLALYTVRDDMETNAKATLMAVAQAGYKNIEAAGYKDGKFYNMAPKDFNKLLKEVGLTPISTHQGGVTLENADTMIADVKAAGFKYFVIPVPPMGLRDDYKQLATVLSTLGEKCQKAGLKLLYHNHDFELKKGEDGVVTLDYLLDNTDPKYVNFQMDLYWVTKADQDPVAYFTKYPGRFIMWHVKDMDEQGRFAPVGNGQINFSAILANKKLSGMKYYMVEQDKTFDMTPLEAINISHKGLIKIGFK